MSQELFSFIILLSMLAGFFIAHFLMKMPAALCLLVTALVGALVGGLGIPIRHIVEGMYGFFGIVAIVLTASIFIAFQRESKGLNTLVRDLIKIFYRVPPLLLIVLMFVIILPGALAGSGTAAVMAVGGLVATILSYIGLSKVRVAGFVAMGGILALVAPPINIPAMIISSGLNMPYAGFFGPLMIWTVILAVVCSLVYGLKEVEKKIDPEKILEKVPSGEFHLGKLGAYLPLLVVVGLMVLQRAWPELLDPGIPLIFVLGAILAFILPKKRPNFIEVCKNTIKKTGPVAALFISVGAVVQIMVATGVRGWIVIEATTAPIVFLYIAVALLIPVMGGVMGTYGVASIFAIPFMMALLGQDLIFGISGLAILCCLASLTPPTAIVGRASLLASGYEEAYGKVLKVTALPWAFVCLAGILTIIFANDLRMLYRLLF